jgi:hypothetical protein
VIAAAGGGIAPRRPPGVTGLGLSLLASSAYLLLLAVLIATSRVSLMSGAYLLEGLEVMGPLVFLLAALLAAIAGVGLLYCRNWARRLALLLAVAFLAGAVPTVSSAVVDFRFATLLREDIKVIAGAVACFYLTQPDTRAAFLKQADAAPHSE